MPPGLLRPGKVAGVDAAGRREVDGRRDRFVQAGNRVVEQLNDILATVDICAWILG